MEECGQPCKHERPGVGAGTRVCPDGKSKKLRPFEYAAIHDGEKCENTRYMCQDTDLSGLGVRPNRSRTFTNQP